MSTTYEETQVPGLFTTLHSERQLDDGIWVVAHAMIRPRDEGGFVCFWCVKAFMDITSMTYVEARDSDDVIAASVEQLKAQFEEQSSLAANVVVKQVRAAIDVWKNPGRSVPS